MATVSQNLLENIYFDLRNERKHMMFYLTNAGSMTGLLSDEYAELFLDSAKEELEHVKEFQNMYVGLGGSLVINAGVEIIPIETDVKRAILAALELEEEVVENYAKRIDEIENDQFADNVTKKWLVVFYEDQLKNSRTDVDKYNRIIKNW